MGGSGLQVHEHPCGSRRGCSGVSAKVEGGCGDPVRIRRLPALCRWMGHWGRRGEARGAHPRRGSRPVEAVHGGARRAGSRTVPPTPLRLRVHWRGDPVHQRPRPSSAQPGDIHLPPSRRATTAARPGIGATASDTPADAGIAAGQTMARPARGHPESRTVAGPRTPARAHPNGHGQRQDIHGGLGLPQAHQARQRRTASCSWWTATTSDARR